MRHELLLTLALIACGRTTTAPKSPAPNNPPPTGNLVVAVAAPNGVTPAIVVSGPNGYTMTLAGVDTLKNLAPGTYTIVADTFAVADSVVGGIISVGTVVGSPASVVGTATVTVSVTYGQTTRRGGVWVANNFSTPLTEIAATDLRASALPTPADTIGGIPNSSGVAMDASGNLWVASSASDTLRMYTIAQRVSGGAPTPAVQITSPSLSKPQQLAFDANGTLWVADVANGLVGFTKDKLTATGTVTATYTIADTNANAGAQAVAFDAHGNAWVASAVAISAYTPAQLTASGSPSPQTVIPGNFYSLAFDTSGNLWVGSFGSVSEYPTGTTTSTIGITVPATDSRVLGLAFDHRGTLWVVQAEGNAESALIGYPAALLWSNNSQPGIVVALNRSIVCPGQLVLDPFAPDPSTASTTMLRVRNRSSESRRPQGVARAGDRG